VGIGAVGPSSHVGIPTSQESSASVGTASFVFNIPTSQGGSEGDTSSVNGLPASQWVNGGDVVDLSLDPDPSQDIWPSTTDLVFNPGTTKVTLGLQRGPLRAIIHDSFEKLRAFLLINYSYPGATTLPMVIKNCLVTAAAESHYACASDIRERLTQDDKYLDIVSRLVRVSYYLIITSLIALAAACSYLNLPLGGQGALCSCCSGHVLGRWHSAQYCSNGRPTADGLLLYVSDIQEGEYVFFR
jgi:hypothetical protein